MPLVKGKHYPYTAAGKKAAARARMKKGGTVRRSDPEKRESVRSRAEEAARTKKKIRRSDPERRGSVRSRAAEAALTPLERAARNLKKGLRGPKKAGQTKSTKRKKSGRYPGAQVDYIRNQLTKKKKGGLVRKKYAKGGAVNLNRTTRGPNN